MPDYFQNEISNLVLKFYRVHQRINNISEANMKLIRHPECSTIKACYTDLVPSNYTANEQSSVPKPKVHWSKLTKDEINENYTAPLLTELLNIDLDLLTGTESDVNTVANLILTNSKSFAVLIYFKKNKKKKLCQSASICDVFSQTM